MVRLFVQVQYLILPTALRFIMHRLEKIKICITFETLIIKSARGIVDAILRYASLRSLLLLYGGSFLPNDRLHKTFYTLQLLLSIFHNYYSLPEFSRPNGILFFSILSRSVCYIHL